MAHVNPATVFNVCQSAQYISMMRARARSTEQINKLIVAIVDRLVPDWKKKCWRRWMFARLPVRNANAAIYTNYALHGRSFHENELFCPFVKLAPELRPIGYFWSRCEGYQIRAPITSCICCHLNAVKMKIHWNSFRLRFQTMKNLLWSPRKRVTGLKSILLVAPRTEEIFIYVFSAHFSYILICILNVRIAWPW